MPTEITENIIQNPDKSLTKEVIKKSSIDVDALKREYKKLQSYADMPEPPNEELIELGKTIHPYYEERDMALARKDEILAFLKKYSLDKDLSDNQVIGGRIR